MSAQILITGATGFIGRQLTRDLVGRGAAVRVLARSRCKARELFGDDVEICVGDLGDTVALDAACQGVETIYHIGGTYRFGLRHRRELWRTNVEGAENILRSAWNARVEKVVHLSSGGVLRRVDDTRLLDEDRFSQRRRRAFAPTRPRSGTRKCALWLGRNAACRSVSRARRARSVAAMRPRRRPGE